MGKILTYVFEEQANSMAIGFDEQVDTLFNITVVPINEKKQSAESLWMQIVNLVKVAKKGKETRMIISKGFEVINSIKNVDLLLEVITDAADLHAKLLIGSTSSVDATFIPLTANLLWTDSVSDTEFLVIYESCFDLILNEEFLNYSSIAECLESITSNKTLIYPMITISPNPNYQALQVRMERLIKMQGHLQKNKLKLKKK